MLSWAGREIRQTWTAVGSVLIETPCALGQVCRRRSLRKGVVSTIRRHPDEAPGLGNSSTLPPRANVVIVKQSHWPEEWVDAMEMETYSFFDAVVQALP